MTKFASSVRFKVRPGSVDKVRNLFVNYDISTLGGALSHEVIEFGEGKFQTTVIWESEQCLADARPELVAFLNTIRADLEELSPELGVTDPISGKLIAELGSK